MNLMIQYLIMENVLNLPIFIFNHRIFYNLNKMMYIAPIIEVDHIMTDSANISKS
jgi:hypothetical protein